MSEGREYDGKPLLSRESQQPTNIDETDRATAAIDNLPQLGQSTSSSSSRKFPTIRMTASSEGYAQSNNQQVYTLTI
jgi:hypothetical protein